MGSHIISRRRLAAAAAAMLVSASLAAGLGAWEGAGPLVIEHTCAAGLSRIPPAWIDTARVSTRIYYGHTSHGKQVTEGLRRVEEADSFYAYAVGNRSLPSDSASFCVYDDESVTPATYCTTAEGMDRTRGVLSDNPTINISMFMWCIELNTWTESQVQGYLDSLEVLEAEFPHVTFIYATGNAQYEGGEGYNRYLRNEQIRAYCTANDKVLFDFGDMDAWWYDPATSEWQQNTYEYDGHTVPREHSQYHGDEWGHTTFESCEVKGRGAWWMAAMLSGWHADPTDVRNTSLSGLKDLFRR
jgi:hypothetical protein